MTKPDNRNVPLRQYRILLVKYLKPQGWWVLVLTILLFITTGLQLLNPQILRLFIDTAVSGSGSDKLGGAALLFIGLALLGQILNIVTTYVSERVGWTATNWLRTDLTEHCLSLDMPFHNSRSPGELIERVDGDITAMANFFSLFVLKIVGNLLLLIGVLVLVFLEDWRVGLGLLIFSIITVALLSFIRNAAVPASRQERESTADLFGFLEERLAGLEDVRANGASPYVMFRMYERLRDLFHKSYRAWNAIQLAWICVNGMFTIAYVLMLAAGASLLSAGTISLGTVYLFFQYTDMLRNPFQQMTRQIEDLQKASAGIIRVQELYLLQPAIQDHGTIKLPPGPLSVEFEKVSFSYNSIDPIIHDLSFALQPGQVLGLLGRTGSGKTTLSRLLFRLYETDQGAIRVGGVPVHSTPISQLRHRVGLVTQEVQLFHASVRDNLTFFNPAITDDRIMEVINDLGLHDWFARLPNGLDTEFRTGGAGLSAGEAQLLAFTRVFLEDPGLVILDEASSRLDPATERLIERAVDKLLQNRTGIIIAHRLATVQRADKILVLEDGHLLEYGPRLELARQPTSHFYGLMQTGLEGVLA